MLSLGLATVAAVLSSCGGDNDSQNDEAQIRETVEGFYRAFGRGDGEDACSRLTDDVASRMAADLTSVAHDFGDLEDVEPGQLSCADVVERADQPGEGRAFAVSSIEIDGDHAKAVIERDAGTVALVREGDLWLITSFGGPTY